MSGAPRLYFSFRSPFSWLLVERLRRLEPGAFERLELIPYWEPDARTAKALFESGATIRYAPMSKAKHLYILQDVKRLAARLELAMSWPVDLDPWWEPSHLGWLAAASQGAATVFYDAIVAARWSRGEDISRPEVVLAVADRAGLDGGAIIAAVDDPAIRQRGVACLRRADDDDVFGVPYLRLGWQRFWGFDRLDAFLEAAGLPNAGGAADPLARVPSGVLRSPGMYDEDTAGGCG